MSSVRRPAARSRGVSTPDQCFCLFRGALGIGEAHKRAVNKYRRPEWPTCTSNFTFSSHYFSMTSLLLHSSFLTLNLHVPSVFFICIKQDALREKNKTTIEPLIVFLLSSQKRSCFWLFFFVPRFVPVCWWSISLLRKPYSPLPAFRFLLLLTDLSPSPYQGLPSFFSAVEYNDVLGVYVCVCVCVLSFPDLELIPFKILLNTFKWAWFHVC